MTGRTPPSLEEVTLSSGITVKIRKVSPFSLDAVRRLYPRPQPPIVDNDYGDGQKRREPNPADPDYLLALEEYKALLTTKITEAMLHLGIKTDIDTDAVAAFREEIGALGVALDESDRLVYIRHILIQTEDDLQRLAEAITRKTMPTEEAVQEHLATFSGDIQGPGSDGDPAAPVGG